MTDFAPDSSTLPPAIAEWVQVNPLPTQLLDEDGEPLLTNGAFTDLLSQLGWGSGDLLSELLLTQGEDSPAPREWLANLRPGECLVRKLWPERDEPYTFHLVKLVLSEGSCICCMLMPTEDHSETRFTGILNAMTCFVLEFDARGKVSYLNDPLRAHLGYALRELRRLTHLRQLLDGFSEDELRRRLAEVGERGRVHFRGKLIRQDGTAIPMEMSIVGSQSGGESLYLLSARDIGAQLAHEATLNTALAAAERQAEASKGEIRDLRARLGRQAGETRPVYRSEAFGSVVRRVHHLAELNVPVLITGEPGTGKRLLARHLHELSRRADRSLVTVDCAALPPALVGRELFGGATAPGGLRAAAGGTLLLHAVEALPPPVQAKLARFLQDGEFTSRYGDQAATVDVRILCTTTQDLQSLVDEGAFLAELFYRLNVSRVASIPLRKRRDDIPPLIVHFIQQCNQRFGKEISGVAATTVNRLEAYDFPGNVGELKRLIERAFITATEGVLPVIVPPDMPAPGGSASQAPPVLDLFDGTLTAFVSFEEYQRRYIQLVLDSTGGKVSGPGGAADILQMHPQTLFSKLRKLGIRR
ncbi:sigma 54-interacting transcriptional regulator [Lewinella sp. IMCC34183]|uniref:sigma 54-interacting transcriptional regulator n=1 Tax=Lewinella sp. IMCC34183 TaxID=2248762 RepID=UPI000E26E692|nr:sigma 54-interacting transcriptional regulator [Lewinella sp. IMCC34183]